jgi:hypothetical protein
MASGLVVTGCRSVPSALIEKLLSFFSVPPGTAVLRKLWLNLLF